MDKVIKNFNNLKIKFIVLVLIIIGFINILSCDTAKRKITVTNPGVDENPIIINQNSNISKKIDEYMRTYEQKNFFSGVVLAAKKEEILINKGYGLANYELDVPNMPATKFHLGSVTKQFTAMAVMQLQERGLLNVNETINKYLPDYPNGKSITLHQLLIHTSGIPDYINDDVTYTDISRLYHTLDEVIGRFKDKPLEFKPGTRFDYSNSGYVLLSRIIEKVSGETYEEFLAENIFKPLNMKNTGYDHMECLVKNRACGYIVSSDRLENADFFDRSNLQGADGLYSTALDLYLWDRALNTEKLASKATLEKMFTPYPPTGTYGYGWRTDGKTMNHYGRMDGFYTYISRNTVDDVTVIILSNIEQVPLTVITQDIDAIIFDREYQAPKNLVDIKVDYKN